MLARRLPRSTRPTSLLPRLTPMATRAIGRLQIATPFLPTRQVRTPPSPSPWRPPDPPLPRSTGPARRSGEDRRACTGDRAGGCAGLPVVHHALFSAPQLAAGHRFPMGVFEAIHDMLLREGMVRPAQVVTPHPVPLASDLLRVHCPQYVALFCQGALPPAAMRRIGFPWSRTLVRRTLAEVAGTLLTAQLALEHGLACSTAGGTHHAFRDYGSGYCILNDLAVTAAALTCSTVHPTAPDPPLPSPSTSPAVPSLAQAFSSQSVPPAASLPSVLPAAASLPAAPAPAIAAAEGKKQDLWRELLAGAEDREGERVVKRVQRVAIVDLDVHQGDGTAAMLATCPNVFTFSMHCGANFPARKQHLPGWVV
ncbi:hypothetical protein CLOP_g7901 [Closterium sp. NIES-67]|nr:hypothetical protein CLOP_g7901 [Closterium sp. NIES-67]